MLHRHQEFYSIGHEQRASTFLKIGWRSRERKPNDSASSAKCYHSRRLSVEYPIPLGREETNDLRKLIKNTSTDYGSNAAFVLEIAQGLPAA